MLLHRAIVFCAQVEGAANLLFRRASELHVRGDAVRQFPYQFWSFLFDLFLGPDDSFNVFERTRWWLLRPYFFLLNLFPDLSAHIHIISSPHRFIILTMTCFSHIIPKLLQSRPNRHQINTKLTTTQRSPRHNKSHRHPRPHLLPPRGRTRSRPRKDPRHRTLGHDNPTPATRPRRTNDLPRLPAHPQSHLHPQLRHPCRPPPQHFSSQYDLRTHRDARVPPTEARPGWNSAYRADVDARRGWGREGWREGADHGGG